MAKTTDVQTNFTGGEVTPRIRGRSDFKKFANSCEKLINFVPSVHGVINNRSGTKHVAKSAASNRLIEFEFSETQTYIIEFGNLYVRFYSNRAQVTTTASITAGSWSSGTATVTVASHDALVGDKISVSGVTPSGYNVTNAIVTAVTATTVSYAVASDPGSYTSGGTLTFPYQVTSPYSDSDLSELQYTQSADVLFLVHPDYGPRELQRSAATSWAFVEFDFKDGPYDDVNVTSTTLALSGTSGSVTVTASAVTGINGGDGFKSTDVGRRIRFNDGSNWTWLEITAFTSTTVVTATIRGENPSSGSAVDNWRLGSWSDTDGWPWTITFHQNRLWFGGSDANPQNLWGTKDNDFDNFEPTKRDGTVEDTSGLTFQIASNKVNAIRWLQSDEKGLLIGTQGGEWVGRSRTEFDPITPTTFAVKRQGSRGSASNVRVHQIGSSVVFNQRAGKRFYDTSFRFDSDRYSAEDLTLLADHLFAQTTVKDVAYQQEPNTTMWVVTADGNLYSMTYHKDQTVVAWAKHNLGGTNVQVQSVGVISDTPYDLVYVIVKRTIDSSTVYHIEYIEDRFEIDDEICDAYFVDNGITYDSTATTSITGLGHLEGETVAILADGAVHPDKVVSSGSITLNYSASTVHVGLPITSEIKTMPLWPDRLPYEPRGKLNRISEVLVQLHQSVNFSIDTNNGTFETILFRKVNDPMTDNIDLFTGTKRWAAGGMNDYESQIHIKQDKPLPITIVSLVARMQFGDE